MLPFVAILMGMKLSGMHAQRAKGIEGEALKRLILKSVRDLLAKATESGPGGDRDRRLALGRPELH